MSGVDFRRTIVADVVIRVPDRRTYACVICARMPVDQDDELLDDGDLVVDWTLESLRLVGVIECGGDGSPMAGLED